jgi:hypothetical protein
LELAEIDMIPLVPIRPFKAELGFVLKACVLELTSLGPMWQNNVIPWVVGKFICCKKGVFCVLGEQYIHPMNSFFVCNECIIPFWSCSLYED